jgi:putative Mg2+ transporter-C (MgtC) family protein
MQLNDAIPLTTLDSELLIRLGTATLLGLILGLDRELRGHDAGIRTHAIISLTAAVLTISILSLYFQIEGVRFDALRLYEATTGFVGLMGAGLIVFSRGRLHNLTTAAHLWLASMIGIACGAGQWPLVATASVIGFVVLSVLHFIERWLPSAAMRKHAPREGQPSPEPPQLQPGQTDD